MTLQLEQINMVTTVVEDIDDTRSFYCDTLGLEEVETKPDILEVRVGDNHLRFMEQTKDKDLISFSTHPGSLDITFETKQPVTKIVEELGKAEILLLSGPNNLFVDGRDAQNVHLRDPDNNLIEIITYNTKEIANYEKQPQNKFFTMRQINPGVQGSKQVNLH